MVNWVGQMRCSLLRRPVGRTNDNGRPAISRCVLFPCILGFIGIILALVILTPSILVSAQSVDKLRREAQKAIQVGNIDKAEQIYRRLLVKRDDDHETRLDLSYLLIKIGRLNEGFREASRVVNTDQQNARAHALQGMALLRSGMFTPAINELTVGFFLDQQEPIALAGLAEVDFFENRPEEAYYKLRRATSLDPREPEYWIAYGRTAARLERFKEAAKYYERFLSVSPKLEDEKRERFQGLIDFYRALGRSNITLLHQVEGPKTHTLPFQLQNSRPYIQIKVNGGDSLTFVIDTGASITVLSERAAQQLSIQPMARGGRARAVGGGGTFPIVYGLVRGIELGETKIYNVPVYIRRLHHFAQSQAGHRLSVDGFLGLSVLTNFRITLDYAHRQLVLERGAGPDLKESLPAEASVVPFRTTNGGLISAEAQLGNQERFNFLVDSGASTTVLSGDVVQRLNWQDKLLPDLKVRVLGAAGVIEEVDLMVVPSFTIHDLEQRNVRAPILNMSAVNETAGFLQAGIIGGSFLRHFRVTFDFQRFHLVFLPQTEAVRRIVPADEQKVQEKQSED